MNTEVQEHEERHAALMAVQGALTDAEVVELKHGAAEKTGLLVQGMTAADVLDHTTDYDLLLEQTEPFLEQYAGQLPQDVRLQAALHAVILLGRPLTPGRVIALLQRAGMADVPRYPDVEVPLLLGDGTDAQSGLVMRLALSALAELPGGPGKDELDEFRASVRWTDDLGRHMADIAAWVTLADKVREAPHEAYDPTHDIAVVLAWLKMHGVDAPVRPALTSLRSHLDTRSTETIEASLRDFYGKEAGE